MKEVASLNKLSTLIEFIRCMPVIVRRDKNASVGMKYAMTSALNANSGGGSDSQSATNSVRR